MNDDADDIPSTDVRSAKRARLQDLGTSHINEGSCQIEAAVPASRAPALHTTALRSVLKGVVSFAEHLTERSAMKSTDLLAAALAVFVVKAGQYVC